MTIVNKKFYDSAFTLPLATTQSTSAIKLKTVPYALLCSRETGAAPAPIRHTDLTYVKLVMGLHSWCREAEGTQEHRKRLSVAQEIQKCYVSKEPTLELFECQALTSLPAAIGNLSHLTKLYLYCQSLTSLPPEISNLSNLTTLELHCPALTSLPETIGNLSNLTEILLGCPALTSLPAKIGKLSQLTFLALLGCLAFTSLPETIGNLSNLTTLSLIDCPALTSLPNALARLPESCVFSTEGCGLDARASIAFQDAITRAGMENPTHGPRWLNTVHETPLPDTNTFD